MSVIAYIFDIFNKCDDNDTPVATFVATLGITLAVGHCCSKKWSMLLLLCAIYDQICDPQKTMLNTKVWHYLRSKIYLQLLPEIIDG